MKPCTGCKHLITFHVIQHRAVCAAKDAPPLIEVSPYTGHYETRYSDRR